MAQIRIAAPPAPAAGRDAFPRRDLLRAALSGAVAVAASVPAAARQKMSQAAAQYQQQPKGGFSCAACALFRPPHSCVVVSGAISPHGWCKFFDLPD